MLQGVEKIKVCVVGRFIIFILVFLNLVFDLLLSFHRGNWHLARVGSLKVAGFYSNFESFSCFILTNEILNLSKKKRNFEGMIPCLSLLKKTLNLHPTTQASLDVIKTLIVHEDQQFLILYL